MGVWGGRAGSPGRFVCTPGLCLPAPAVHLATDTRPPQPAPWKERSDALQISLPPPAPLWTEHHVASGDART